MRKHIQITVPQDRVTSFCRKWSIAELALFGSVLRDDFQPDSDVDVLVTFAPGTRWGFEQMLDMKAELGDLLGRPIDLVEKQLIDESPNYIRRKHILAHMETIYVAG